MKTILEVAELCRAKLNGGNAGGITGGTNKVDVMFGKAVEVELAVG